MGKPNDSVVRDRVIRRAIELIFERPGVDIDRCLALADAEDLIIYGNPDAARPRGLMPAPVASKEHR